MRNKQTKKKKEREREGSGHMGRRGRKERQPDHLYLGICACVLIHVRLVEKRSRAPSLLAQIQKQLPFTFLIHRPVKTGEERTPFSLSLSLRCCCCLLLWTLVTTPATWSKRRFRAEEQMVLFPTKKARPSPTSFWNLIAAGENNDNKLAALHVFHFVINRLCPSSSFIVCVCVCVCIV